METVDRYRYLGIHLNDGLDWRTISDAVYKKGMSTMYFLRKLRSINVCSKMLEIFYQPVIVSFIYFAVVCWRCSIIDRDTMSVLLLLLLNFYFCFVFVYQKIEIPALFLMAFKTAMMLNTGAHERQIFTFPQSCSSFSHGLSNKLNLDQHWVLSFVYFF